MPHLSTVIRPGLIKSDKAFIFTPAKGDARLTKGSRALLAALFREVHLQTERQFKMRQSCGVTELANHFTLVKCKRTESFSKTSNQLFKRFHCSAGWSRNSFCTQQFLPEDCNINRMFILSAPPHR